MPLRTSRTAIIIGGGIGGLAAGIALRQDGFRVEVFERAPRLHEVGAGLTLWPNAVRALRHLGLGEAVAALAVPEVAGGLRTPDGTLLLATSTADVQRLFGEPTLVLHRADLQRVLLDAIGAECVRLGATFRRFEWGDERVTAHFEDGTEAHGALLVGADGLRSVVRAQLHGERAPTYAGYTAWRAVVPFNVHDLQPGETWGAGARFGQVPLSDGRAYWFATKNAPEGARSPGGEKAELLLLFGGWHAPIEALITATDEGALLRNDVYDRPPLQAWGRGRVTLLGDAAHPMTPNLGQGACQALEDAVVLARCLRDAVGPPEGLRAYEARRIPRTTALVEQSRRIGRVGQWQHPAATYARALLVRHVASRTQGRQLRRVVGSALDPVQ